MDEGFTIPEENRTAPERSQEFSLPPDATGESFSLPPEGVALGRVRSMTPEALADAAPDASSLLRDFNTLNASSTKLTASDVGKLQDAYDRKRQADMSLGRALGGVTEIPHALGNLASGVYQTGKNVVKGLTGDREAGANLTAASDTAGTSDVSLGRSFFRKLAQYPTWLTGPVPKLVGKAFGENWDPKTQTPQDRSNQFFTDAALLQQSEQSAHGEGYWAQKLGTDQATLAKEGVTLNADNIAKMAGAIDPINLLPVGAGWEAVTKSGLSLFTAPTREIAASLVEKLGQGMQAAGGKIAALGEAGNAMLKKPLSGAAGAGTIAGAIATGNTPLVAKAAAGVVVPSFVKGAGKAIEAGGKLLSGETAIPAPILRLGEKAAEGAAAGAASSAPFAYAQEDSANIAPIIGTGAVLGAAGSLAGHAKESAADAAETFVKNKFQEEEKAGTQRHAGYGTDTTLDAIHSAAMDYLDEKAPKIASAVNRVRTLLPAIAEAEGAKGPTPEAYVLPAKDFDTRFPKQAGQAGFIDPQNNRAFLRLDGNNLDALTHEPAHIVDSLLPEAVREKANAALEKAYGPAIDDFGRRYDAWFNASRPDQPPATFSHDYYLTELRTEHLSAMLRGDKLEGLPKDFKSSVGSFLESAGLYKPGLGERDNGANITELGVKVSPKVMNALADFFRNGTSSPEVRDALSRIAEPPPVIGPDGNPVPPESKKAVQMRDLSREAFPKTAPAAPPEPIQGSIINPARRSAEPPFTLPPEALKLENPAPPSAEPQDSPALTSAKAKLRAGKVRELTKEEAQAFQAWQEEVSAAAPDLAKEEAEAVQDIQRRQQEPPVTKTDQNLLPPTAPEPKSETPPNLRVTPEQQAGLNRPPERTDIGIQEAAEAVKTAPPEQQAVFNQIREHLHQPQGEIAPLEIVYNSAAREEGTPATERTQRRAEQEGEPEEREAAQKLVVPTGFVTTKSGKVQIAAYSPDKILSAAQRIAEDAASKKAAQLIPYSMDEQGRFTPESQAKLNRDLLTYASNQANGYAGSGKTLLRPKDYSGFIPPENPDYTPKPLTEHVAHFLNLVMGIAPPKTARVNKSSFTGLPIRPTNVRARELAEVNLRPALKPGVIGDPTKQVFKDFGNVEIAEFNPLRKQLDEHGVNTRERIETTERLNLDQIQSVTPKPESGFRAPSAEMISAGFMPRRPDLSLQEVADLSPEDFSAQSRAWPGGLTGAAVRLGKTLPIEELPKLQQLRDEALQRLGAYKAQHDFDGALAEVGRAQFFREASEAARAAHGEEGLSIQPKDLAAFMPARTRTASPASLPDNLSDVPRHTSNLRRHPEFQAAKYEGDDDAAAEIVAQDLKPAVIEKIRKRLEPGLPVVVTPVHSEERTGKSNRIPFAYADALALELGGEVRDDIVKVAGAHNTDATRQERAENQQRVEGPVDPDVQYVLVDDTFTTGDTLYTYLDHILSNGGRVSAVTTLASSRNGNYLKPRPQDVAKVIDRSGVNRKTLEDEIGVNLDKFTGSEIYQLANLTRTKSPEQFRANIGLLAGKEAGGRSDARGGGSPEPSAGGEAGQGGLSSLQFMPAVQSALNAGHVIILPKVSTGFMALPIAPAKKPDFSKLELRHRR